MRPNPRLILAAICLLAALPLREATAQRGQLIEGLFRTLAESHLEREKAQRAEAEARARARSKATNTRPANNPYQVKLPSGFGGPSPRQPGPTIVPSRPRSGSINVRSQEAAAFAKQLVGFNTQIGPLVADLKASAARNTAIRGVLPEVYRVSAQCQAVIQACDGLSSLQTIVRPYGELDASWRQVSFSLRGINGLSKASTQAIARCDDYCGLMGKQLNIEPQFDRHALNDVIIEAGAYMLALEDDLHIAIGNDPVCQTLTHDLRLLRQRLLREADYVQKMSYDEIAGHFQDYGTRWREFASRVYAYNNPHLHRRLDRISDCGEQTYQLLRIQPPAAQLDLSGAIHRIEHGLEQILGQLSLRAMIRLQPKDQIQLLETCRLLNSQATELKRLGDRKAPAEQIRDQFIKLERGWNSVQRSFQQIPSLNRGTIDEVNHACEEIRVAVGTGHSSQVSVARLLQAAAALEGSSEYLRGEIRKIERSLRPSSFRDSTRDSVDDFYRHSKELHNMLDRPSRLSDQKYLQRLQGEAEHLLQGFDQLSRNLQTIESHGASASQALRLRRLQREVMPHIAQIAAALLQ